jgi:hypothetical protein
MSHPANAGGPSSRTSTRRLGSSGQEADRKAGGEDDHKATLGQIGRAACIKDGMCMVQRGLKSHSVRNPRPTSTPRYHGVGGFEFLHMGLRIAQNGNAPPMPMIHRPTSPTAYRGPLIPPSHLIFRGLPCTRPTNVPSFFLPFQQALLRLGLHPSSSSFLGPSSGVFLYVSSVGPTIEDS